MRLVFSLIDSDDLTLQMIAIETLGFIGESSDGKVALEKQGWCIYLTCGLWSSLNVFH